MLCAHNLDTPGSNDLIQVPKLPPSLVSGIDCGIVLGHTWTLYRHVKASEFYSTADWVWCGDKERCDDQYRDCWLKHTVSPHQDKIFIYIINNLPCLFCESLKYPFHEGKSVCLVEKKEQYCNLGPWALSELYLYFFIWWTISLRTGRS